MPSKILILREDKPAIGKVIGDVVDILDSEQFEGSEVKAIGKSYVRVISDISEELKEEFLSGVKRLRSPDLKDPFYKELLTNTYVEVTEQVLLNYVELT